MINNDFWLTSGWHLLDKNKEGHLVPTEDFMRAYFYRPEVAPIEESCPAEIELHKRLIDNPFVSIEKNDLQKIKDKDVIFNYEVILRFRDFLSHYPTLDSAYLAIARGKEIDFPPLFVDQVVQIILRNILNDCPYALQVRASELFFRTQVDKSQTLKSWQVWKSCFSFMDMNSSFFCASMQNRKYFTWI